VLRKSGASGKRRASDNVQSLVDTGSFVFADDDTLPNAGLIAG
jgi:hypothetical protein